MNNAKTYRFDSYSPSLSERGLGGEVTSGYRPIKSGAEYDRLFPKAEKEDRIIIQDGDVDDTVDLMQKVVWKYIDDTKELAKLLKRSSLHDTCQALWSFVYTHVQYQLDQRGLEQLRRPARTWADRKTGADCDCMSIFVSSVLTNMGIPHSFRITKYSKPSWQHVYVVVPHGNGQYIIDAVVSKFNYEKPFTAKKDYPMNLHGIDVAVLSGYEEHDVLSEALFGYACAMDGLGALNSQQELDALYKHLVATRNAVLQNPALVAPVDDPQGFLKMLDYAITYWYTDKRQEALDQLARYEHQLNLKNGFSGYEEEIMGMDELGKIQLKKVFSKVGTAVKKGAKAVGKTVLKFNPLTISARAGFLLSMKMNLKKMGSKIKWAYATQEQAAKKGISATDWKKAKDALAKVEKLFVSKLQGKASALKNAVLKGKAGNLNGVVEYREGEELQGLGFAPAAALAAAVPIIKAVLGILKSSGMIQPGEDMNTDNLANELANDPSVTSAMQSIESEDTEITQLPAVQNTAVAKSSAVVQSNALVATNADSAAPTGGNKLMNFIKANPIPSLLVGGVVAFGVYKMLKPKKATGVSGLGRLPKQKKKSKHKKRGGHKGKKQALKRIKLF